MDSNGFMIEAIIETRRDPFIWMRGTLRIGAKSFLERTLPGPSPTANLVGDWKDKWEWLYQTGLPPLLFLPTFG